MLLPCKSCDCNSVPYYHRPIPPGTPNNTPINAYHSLKQDGRDNDCYYYLVAHFFFFFLDKQKRKPIILLCVSSSAVVWKKVVVPLHTCWHDTSCCIFFRWTLRHHFFIFLFHRKGVSVARTIYSSKRFIAVGIRRVLVPKANPIQMRLSADFSCWYLNKICLVWTWISYWRCLVSKLQSLLFVYFVAYCFCVTVFSNILPSVELGVTKESLHIQG